MRGPSTWEHDWVMEGWAHLDSWDYLIIWLELLSLFVMAFAIPVSAGGLVWWWTRRRFPPSRLVQTCMVLAVTIPAIWLGAKAVASWSTSLDQVEIETAGRLCGAEGMGTPHLCEDTHLCAEVPERYAEELVACRQQCGAACPCPLQIISTAAVRLEDDSDEWVIWADRTGLDERQPAIYNNDPVWYRVSGPLESPDSMELIGGTDAASLIWDHQSTTGDRELRLVRVTGPPDPSTCVAYLHDPGPVTYTFDSR